jgi:phospholipid/cholesterol/gamma-HCH transport system substrate-binding protein
MKSGDTIPLARTGRNPEVEEVLSALSAVLNGGGVAQLKTIASELNQASSGREQDIRSVLSQIHYFMGELDANKTAVISAITNVDRLARGLRSQDATIKSTLDDLPAAIRSVNGQRADLVRMLRGLNRLSDVGVRVIQASKESTIDSLNDLAPVLSALAKAGQAFPKSLQVSLTYPFLDAAVGNSPTVARNLHMGDWVNLSIFLDLDLQHLTIPGLPDLKGTLIGLCKQLPSQLAALASVCQKLGGALGAVPSSNALTDRLNQLLGHQIGGATGATGGTTGAAGSSDGTGKQTGSSPSSGPSPSASPSPSGNPLGNLLHGLGLGRAELGAAYRKPTAADPFGLRGRGLDPGIGTLLLQGVLAQ